MEQRELMEHKDVFVKTRIFSGHFVDSKSDAVVLFHRFRVWGHPFADGIVARLLLSTSNVNKQISLSEDANQVKAVSDQYTPRLLFNHCLNYVAQWCFRRHAGRLGWFQSADWLLHE